MHLEITQLDLLHILIRHFLAGQISAQIGIIEPFVLINNWFFYDNRNFSSVSSLYRFSFVINGKTTFLLLVAGHESIFGAWFSEAGNPLNFSSEYITSATDTSPFFVETGGMANKLIEYNGLTIFCKNKSYNVSGTTQNNIRVTPLTAKGVVGNGAFVVNGQCAYIDSFANNIFILTNQIDGTIGFDSPIGNDIGLFI